MAWVLIHRHGSPHERVPERLGDLIVTMIPLGDLVFPLVDRAVRRMFWLR